jgi:hypothetical protein
VPFDPQKDARGLPAPFDASLVRNGSPKKPALGPEHANLQLMSENSGRDAAPRQASGRRSIADVLDVLATESQDLTLRPIARAEFRDATPGYPPSPKAFNSNGIEDRRADAVRSRTYSTYWRLNRKRIEGRSSSFDLSVMSFDL